MVKREEKCTHTNPKFLVFTSFISTLFYVNDFDELSYFIQHSVAALTHFILCSDSLTIQNGLFWGFWVVCSVMGMCWTADFWRHIFVNNVFEAPFRLDMVSVIFTYQFLSNIINKHSFREFLMARHQKFMFRLLGQKKYGKHLHSSDWSYSWHSIRYSSHIFISSWAPETQKSRRNIMLTSNGTNIFIAKCNSYIGDVPLYLWTVCNKKVSVIISFYYNDLMQMKWFQ